MSLGGTYVKLNAATAYGANALNTSDPTGGDETSLTYWLSWGLDGFTDAGWFYNDSMNPLKIKWETAASTGALSCGQTHTADEAGFLEHMSGSGGAYVVANLNEFLGDWNPSMKTAFVILNASKLKFQIGATEQAPDSCVSVI